MTDWLNKEDSDKRYTQIVCPCGHSHTLELEVPLGDNLEYTCDITNKTYHISFSGHTFFGESGLTEKDKVLKTRVRG